MDLQNLKGLSPKELSALISAANKVQSDNREKAKDSLKTIKDCLELELSKTIEKFTDLFAEEIENYTKHYGKNIHFEGLLSNGQIKVIGSSRERLETQKAEKLLQKDTTDKVKKSTRVKVIS